MKLLVEIAYLGTNYHGYQVQANAVTVQGTLQRALEEFYGTPLMLTGCSRTDAGVHARSFFLTVEGELFENMPAERLPLAMSRYLPSDIAILSAVRVDDGFHARYDVEYKEYEYLIQNTPVMDPFLAGRAWHHPVPLDERLMNECASHFVGKRDFAGFMAQGSPVASTVRTIKYFDVRREGDQVIIRVAADGFLYNMVRILSGTLVNISEGKLNADEVDDIIASCDRKRAGMTLPPDGLYLNKVVYKKKVGQTELN